MNLIISIISMALCIVVNISACTQKSKTSINGDEVDNDQNKTAIVRTKIVTNWKPDTTVILDSFELPLFTSSFSLDSIYDPTDHTGADSKWIYSIKQINDRNPATIEFYVAWEGTCDKLYRSKNPCNILNYHMANAKHVKILLLGGQKTFGCLDTILMGGNNYLGFAILFCDSSNHMNGFNIELFSKEKAINVYCHAKASNKTIQEYYNFLISKWYPEL